MPTGRSLFPVLPARNLRSGRIGPTGRTHGLHIVSRNPRRVFVYDRPASTTAEHKKAVLSLVLGIVGMVVYFPLAFLLDLLPVTGAFVLIASAVVGIALGVAGLVLAVMAKKAGNREGIRTAGFVLSLLSIIINAGWFAFGACVVSFVYSNGTPSGGFWS